ncbi:MAG: hypothetical protein FWD57_07970, partial [Polyangiaceae bacterium]|nr:hypothetical protein [Polyangiaceae bacterium]
MAKRVAEKSSNTIVLVHISDPSFHQLSKETRSTALSVLAKVSASIGKVDGVLINGDDRLKDPNEEWEKAAIISLQVSAEFGLPQENIWVAPRFEDGDDDSDEFGAESDYGEVGGECDSAGGIDLF